MLSHSEDSWKTIAQTLSFPTKAILTLAKKLNNNIRGRDTKETKKQKKKKKNSSQTLRTFMICQIRVLKSFFICISISVRKYDKVSVREKASQCAPHLKTNYYVQSKTEVPFMYRNTVHGP